jgi:hypothetical protein
VYLIRRGNMKSRTLVCITAITLLAALGVPSRLAAQITGSGTTNFIPKWTGSTTLGNSNIFQTGVKVGIRTTSPAATLDALGPNATTGGTAALTVFRAIGGKGGSFSVQTLGKAGTGGGLQLSSGTGGSDIALGGGGSSILLTGGTGAACVPASIRCALVGGNGGSVLLQPGAGESPSGKSGNVLLAPSNGNVGIGTTSPAAKLYVVGNFIATGTKSALVKTSSYGGRQLYAMESPENWFEDFGGAQLVHGRATVKLDPIFAEIVSTEDEYHVFLTPKGDCKGLYVASQSASSFEVRELRHGKGTIAFDYRIVAKRKGYERARLAELKDGEDAHRPEMKLAKE